VQSALLEAMQERQVTIGERSFKLEEPFGYGNSKSTRKRKGYISLSLRAQLRIGFSWIGKLVG